MTGKAVPTPIPSADAIAVADQLGRLDFISALLAVVALLIGLGAIPLFVYLRFRAGEVAQEAIDARMEALEMRIEREAILKMEEMLPTLVADYQALAQNAVTDQQADAIAGAQDDDGNNEPIPDNSGGAGNAAG